MLRAVNKYGFYCIPEQYKKREVCQVLLRGDVYEPNTITLLQRFAAEGDIVSGGCFIGDFLPALSQAAGSRHIHSFEPNPESFEAAKSAIDLNGLKNVKLHPVAVGETTDTLNLKVNFAKGDAMGAMAKIVDQATEGQTIEVAVTPLDDLVPKSRKVSVLHLDIEGHEWPAVLGAQKLIAKHAPLIVLEAGKDWKQRDYQDKLKDAFPDMKYTFAGAMERNAFFIASK